MDLAWPYTGPAEEQPRPLIAALDPVKCHWCFRSFRTGRLAIGPGRFRGLSGELPPKVPSNTGFHHGVSYISIFYNLFFKQPMAMIPNR